MNLSVETQQEVISLEDLCIIFLLSFTVSTCLEMHFRHPKISKFSGGACPRTPLAMPGTVLPAGLLLAAKLAPPKQKSCLRPCFIAAIVLNLPILPSYLLAMLSK